MNEIAPNRNHNVGRRLSETAKSNPDGMAIAMPVRKSGDAYEQLTFQELDDDSNQLAAGLLSMGVQPGMRIVLLVPPSIDFISLVFAMLKAGMVIVLIDPGMGRKNLIRCLEEVEPEGFVAIPLAQAVRTLLKQRFPRSRFHVTVGRRWFWGGKTVSQFRSNSTATPPTCTTKEDDPAAIIFTTGSTGPPKGVLYRHRNFNRQVDDLRDFYHIQPGEIDLPGFPLFALFNCAMGVSTVIPRMDPTRPANVNPRNIITPIQRFAVTQAFGSPALWNVVGKFCENENIKLPSLRRVLSAGAPVPPHVLRRMKNAIADDGDMHTPYGATEALPVASISASEVLGETAERSAKGAGTCVGKRLAGIDWRVIRISDQPINEITQTDPVPQGEIGELIVRGPVVTSEYVTRREANALHKIQDGDTFWHRMGDVGYLDEQERFWFCGRKGHRLQTETGTMYTIPCESILNQHQSVYRSALVGVGTTGSQRPVAIVEPWPEHAPQSDTDRTSLQAEIKQLAAEHELTAPIEDVLIHSSLPVDIRHNSKIFREQLAPWAEQQIRSSPSGS